MLAASDETESVKALEREKNLEQHAEHCLCGLNMFCSETTLQLMRITLNSIIDLVQFLFDVREYDFVLTAKSNQDCIEVTWNWNLTALLWKAY